MIEQQIKNLIAKGITLIPILNEQNELKDKLESFEEQLLEFMMSLEELEGSFEN